MNTNETSNETYVVELKVTRDGVSLLYEMDEDENTLFLEDVLDVKGEHVTLAIPSIVNFKGKDWTVTGIDNRILFGIDDDAVEKIVIPPTVTFICPYPFLYGPEGLKQIEVSDRSMLDLVTIPDGVEVVDNVTITDLRPSADFRYTFNAGHSLLFKQKKDSEKLCLIGYENFKTLVKVVIPSQITIKGKSYPVVEIGEHAFIDCINLTEVIIPETVKYIGAAAFWNCNRLASLNIPQSVRNIGNEAFGFCDSLTEVFIPETVYDIDGAIFPGCNNLQSIVVADGNKFYDSREGCNAIIDSNTDTLIQGCHTTVIPESVKTIGDRAFKWCNGLSIIDLPDSVTTIEELAFVCCFSLTSIGLPQSLKKIGDGAFIECEDLTNVVIPNTVTEIGFAAFMGCTGLTDMVIPDSVTEIGPKAFDCCRNLKEIIVSKASLLEDTGLSEDVKIVDKEAAIAEVVQLLQNNG